ncbi:hypothetical protein K461DRAFT_289549 [Myriangium duriaei CBS 260.36]|uniref:Sulfhydryl oxidase n=1 Tax=Myriangium duriaei CBS 260.36 TaxID=1168546 RepID=A0A9P4JCM7_9PEZI|nr:hypothetical protein K461DRAFT_289549 [Myriangium duriaei CBS 260.36]
MPTAPVRRQRSVVLLGVLSVFLVLLFVTALRSSHSVNNAVSRRPAGAKSAQVLDIQDADLKGHTIMPKLGNETAKAELGRAAWKLLHTTMARFPDKPSTEESAALKSYIHLFQRLYPCGECSQHFRKIIDKYPPQVSSRSTAAAWACHVHNEVNKSLHKELFDCANIGDFYDCGCADDEATEPKKASKGKPAMSAERKQKLTELGRDFDEDSLLPKLKKEGYGRGG